MAQQRPKMSGSANEPPNPAELPDSGVNEPLPAGYGDDQGAPRRRQRPRDRLVNQMAHRLVKVERSKNRWRRVKFALYGLLLLGILVGVAALVWMQYGESLRELLGLPEDPWTYIRNAAGLR